MFEPVIASGGLLPPAPRYLEGVEALCRSRGVLTIADVVVCGFGRLGDWFGVERWGLTPDLIAFAKGVTSGYLPLGGVVAGPRLAEPFWSEEHGPFRHGPTYAGHATSCAAALANLAILEREDLLARALELEPVLYEELLGLSDHPLVSEVRGGVGLLGGVDLPAGLSAAHPNLAIELLESVRESGISRARSNGVWQWPHR